MSYIHSFTSAVLLAAALSLGTAGVTVAAEKKAVPAAAKKAKPLPDPVAKVNGVPIRAAELQKALNAFNKSPSAAQVPAGKEGEVQRFLLNQMIGGELMYQVAKNTPFKDQQAQLEAALGKLKQRFKSDEEYRTALKQQAMTDQELRELLRRNLVIENHIEQVIAPKQTVSDAEVKEFYDKNPETFTQPEQARASHILITVPAGASDADKQKARATAEGLLKQLQGGADFAKLAQENSGCPSSKQGGDLGFFGKGQMVKPFEEAAWALQPGGLSGVVETQFGYHIIKLIEKKPAAQVPFVEVKQKIADSIKRRKVTEATKTTLDEATKKAKIEVFLK